MKNWKEIKLDDSSMWPDPGKITLDKPHLDERGYIQSLVNFPVKNIALIKSKKNTVRSNHYHLTDWHYMYTLKGSYRYYYRKSESSEKLISIEIKEREMLFTPPLEDHATVFLEDSILLVMSRNPRDQISYESDVRRIILINPETLQPNV